MRRTKSKLEDKGILYLIQEEKEYLIKIISRKLEIIVLMDLHKDIFPELQKLNRKSLRDYNKREKQSIYRLKGLIKCKHDNFIFDSKI